MGRQQSTKMSCHTNQSLQSNCKSIVPVVSTFNLIQNFNCYVYSIQPANGIKTERLAVDIEPDTETKKRKLTQNSPAATAAKVQKKIKTTPTDPIGDTTSWFKEHVKMTERREQLRFEQHEQLLQLERKRIEIETKNGETLSELLDVVKKFVNKSN